MKEAEVQGAAFLNVFFCALSNLLICPQAKVFDFPFYLDLQISCVSLHFVYTKEQVIHRKEWKECTCSHTAKSKRRIFSIRFPSAAYALLNAK